MYLMGINFLFKFIKIGFVLGVIHPRLLGSFAESYFLLVVLFRSGYPDHLKFE
ncbi:hypothetical protein YC2023_067292 [Brassica napus]